MTLQNKCISGLAAEAKELHENMGNHDHVSTAAKDVSGKGIGKSEQLLWMEMWSGLRRN